MTDKNRLSNPQDIEIKRLTTVHLEPTDAGGASGSSAGNGGKSDGGANTDDGTAEKRGK